MAKHYTSKEMRDYADAIAGDLADNDNGCVEYSFDDLIPVVEALRQAADAMDKLPSLIESRLGRAEKRQKHDLANELHSYLTWTQPITGKPEVCFADLEKLGRLWERLRKDADELEREKRYEYAAKYDDGFISGSHFNTADGAVYANGNTDFVGVVRREVGEWEPVPEGDGE